MDAALGWIGDVFRWVFSLLPHLLIIRQTHEGVKFVRGKHVVRIGPGLHLYWPIVTEVLVAPIRRQTTNLDTQYLVTADGKSVGVAGILVYEVEDIVALLTQCWDYEETIQDMCMASIKDAVVSMDLDELMHDSVEVEEEMENLLRPDMKHFGIRVIRLTLSDFAPVRVLAHWGWNS